jgi:uncharacterized repeat protein (TIGR01451 family)
MSVKPRQSRWRQSVNRFRLIMSCLVALVVGTSIAPFGAASGAAMQGPSFTNPPTDLTCAAGETKYLAPAGSLLTTSGPGPINTGITLAAGERITITRTLSWDGYATRTTASQANEQWGVRVGSQTSQATPDLADLVAYADTSAVSGALGSIAATSSAAVEIIHSSLFIPTDSSPNSVHPVGFCYTIERPFDLSILKVVTNNGPFPVGSTVTYRIIVSNNSAVAAKGWTMTDLAAPGVTLTDLAPVVVGSATCTVKPAVCASTGPLASGASVAIAVTATVTATSGSVRNVAYVEPAPTDPTETNPLGTPPTVTTDTSTTPTNNDTHVDIAVAPALATTVPATTNPPIIFLPPNPPAPTVPPTSPSASGPAATTPPTPSVAPSTQAPTTVPTQVKGIQVTTVPPIPPTVADVKEIGGQVLSYTGNSDTSVLVTIAGFSLLFGIGLVRKTSRRRHHH